MSLPVKATQKQYKRAIELYEQGGASAVYSFATVTASSLIMFFVTMINRE